MKKLPLAAVLSLLLPAVALCAGDPIVLHVVYNPASGGDQRLTDNARLTQVTNYTAGRRILSVKGSQDFASQLAALKKDGVKVRQMIIDAHGAPGFTQIIDSGNVGQFSGAAGLFTPGAEIWFTSCNTGKGEEGVKFMKAVGNTFLAQGGGRVTASVDYVRFLTPAARALIGPVTMAQGEASPGGYVQLRVQPGGAAKLYYLPPGAQEMLAQADTRGHQIADLAKFQIQTAADLVAMELRLAQEAAKLAQRTAVRAAPLVDRALPVLSPGLYLARRLFDGRK